MAYYHDLREYLEVLENNGKLTRISREINKDTELHPLVRLEFRGLPDEERTAFLFENVTDSRGQKYDIPVAVAVLAGSQEIFALGIKCKPEEIQQKLTAAALGPIAPRIVEDGPVYEEVHMGDTLLEHGGLSEFPIPIATPGYDPAPYITAPCVVTKDPDTGIPNVGMYRIMVKSPTRTGINFAHRGKGGFIHLRKSRERGQPLEAAIVIGGPPNLGYVAVSPLPIDVDEFAVAGGIAGEPVELVKCKTIDLEVPASAEIVIEGEISTSEVEPEAPFGESIGYVGLMDMNPFFTVKCIAHRKKPIWLATFSQYRPSESGIMLTSAVDYTLYHELRYNLQMTNVLSVGTCGMVAIQIEKTDPAGIWQVLEAAVKRMPRAKMIAVVDKDVNVNDFNSVMHAINTRTQPHRDFRIEQFPAMHLGDYSLEPLDHLEQTSPTTDSERPTTSCLLIDATMKWPYPPVSLPTKEFMEKALRIWQEEGLPELKLIEPWWGVNLGFWSEEHKEHAKAAVRGEHYKAGEDYRKRRRPV